MSQRNKRNFGPADNAFQLDDYVLYNLNRTAATYNHVMASALRSYGLTTIEWRILMLLNDQSPSAVSDLARRSVTKMPTLTRMLDRMEQSGLIKRAPRFSDRRIVDICMTQKASKILRLVQTIGQGVYEQAIGNMTDDELDVFCDVLKRMRKNLTISAFEKMADNPK